MSKIEKSEKSVAIHKVETLASQLGKAEALLESGYAELAESLLVVQHNHYWEGDFESWTAYLQHVADKFHIGNKQLYHKIAVVKQLQGAVESEDMTKMGISKAGVLADTFRVYGKLPEKTKDGFSFIEMATEPAVTAKQLKKEIAEIFHAPKPELADWLDLECAFYVTEEEKEEIQEAFRLARQLDPPISTSIRDFMQTKEIILRLCREFIETYSKGEEDALSE